MERGEEELLSVVAHELRTPLTAIGGFTEILLDPPPSVDEAMQRALLERIAANVDQMRLLIDQLLHYSRLEAGKVELQPEPASLATLVQGTVATFGVALVRHTVRVDVPADLAVVVDAGAFSRVLGNLLSNAAKFSPEGSTITIAAGDQATSAAHGSVALDVRDEGIGVAPDQQERIFERFAEASPDHATRGTGIGLSIARRYAELGGGTLTVRSTRGKGSTFTFTIPAADPSRH